MEGKVAVPTRGNEVDDHFGHCEFYTIFSIDESNKVSGKEEFKAPDGCGCKSNIADVLKGKNVGTMLAGNMGQGAVNKVSAAGIEVIRGCSGNVMDVIAAYLDGKLNDSGIVCSHLTVDHDGHGHGHSCGNH